MIHSDASPTPRWRHVVRLAVFAAFLAGLFYLVAVTRIIDVGDVRRTVAATGPVAPLTYVVVSAVLGAVFVPGPILAAGSGVLFGPVLGTFVTLGATVGTATIAGLAGRRAGRDSARALLGTQRAERLDALIDRGGLWAVVGQRFVPGISDAGLLCVRRVRSSVVADGRGSVHRICAARIRLHRARCVDRRSIVSVGIRRDRRMVRNRDRRHVRRAARIPTMAWSG
jgi:hypothetical protein